MAGAVGEALLGVKQSQCLCADFKYRRSILKIKIRPRIRSQLVRLNPSFVRLLLRFRLFQQDRQLVLPKRGDGVAAVAAGFVAQWNDDRASVRNTFDFAI